MVAIESAGITHIGKRRKANEDAIFCDDGLGLYVVADGMGGHQAGEVASRMVIETMHDFIQQSRDNNHGREAGQCDTSLSPEANRLLSCLQLSNQAVHQAALSNASYKGMGSTVSAVYFTDQTLITANVGDSPIYLIRNGSIKLLSVPHTVIAEQIALNPDNADLLGDRFNHMLTRAMGVAASVEPDIHEVQYFKNDMLVISSDGLSDKASPEEIFRTVHKRSCAEACRALVELANERGGDDNVTAIVLRIKKTPSRYGGMKGYMSSKIRQIFTSSQK